MFEKFIAQGNFSLLSKSLESGDNISVFGLNIGEKLALVEDSAFLFYVVDSVDKSNLIFDKLTSLGRKCEILTDFPTVLTSEFISFDKYIKILSSLKRGSIDTLIISSSVLAGRFPSPERLNTIEIKKKDKLNITEFIKTLSGLNYKRVDLVSNPNEFSVRGDVIDIYPVNSSPTRILIDFDEVESIKAYNPVTMLTTGELSFLEITPCNYYRVDKQDIVDTFEEYKQDPTREYLDMTEDTRTNYKLINFDKDICHTIFDYVDGGTIVFDGAKAIYDNLSLYIQEFNKSLENTEKPFNIISAKQKLNITDCLKFSSNFTLLAFHFIQQANRIFSPNKVFSIRTLPSTNYSRHDNVLILDINNFIKQNYTVILSAGSDENALNYFNLFENNNIHSYINKTFSQCNKGAVNIVSRSYPLDVILPDEKLAIISTDSLLGKKKKVVEIDKGFFDGETPKAGDYVVHNFHGVGKCLGVETLKISNSFRDYVIIEYKNNDKLYLPVENIDQISKFMGSDTSPTLNKIGGVEFAKTKSKIKSSVKKIAFDLIALYRDRMALKGTIYPKDDELQSKFELDFGYTETIDQLKAIDECKSDMESGKVMDRLVCGDVGFGKTEVALRIAFKTILAGKQVAFLCPTTILSEQHYNTALSRMGDYGIKVEVINRLKTAQEVTKIKKDLASGKIDMICGTHKLLANDIEYKNLGLLILDEEQKFGVADKEKIKNYKKHINVLTLSATPIPRTLNMSLIGVRDISVIETPPVQRIPSIVQVVEYSDHLLKTAIEREIARGGQVLIIYNRVETIYKFSSYVRNLVGDLNISVAHGQMTDTELESEIFRLYSGETQVLISTTLIENGVDLPNANTLIVVYADKLGLSQLYQLKGRIGRSDKQGYAFFTFDNRKCLSENAYKRLQAIEEFSEMGSGFKIAMRDLEIRGAGSLLGLEQSGHIEKIGYNMYVELLSESVKELQGEEINRKTDVKVETNLSAYLSKDYVSSMSRRMSMYRDIANIDSDEKLNTFIANTESIYGDIPYSLINLSQIGYIKNLCGKLGAFKITIREKVCIYLSEKTSISKRMLEINEQFEDFITLNLIDMPVIEISGIEKEKILDFIIKYLKLLVA